jgi:hypothetical protein
MEIELRTCLRKSIGEPYFKMWLESELNRLLKEKDVELFKKGNMGMEDLKLFGVQDKIEYSLYNFLLEQWKEYNKKVMKEEKDDWETVGDRSKERNSRDYLWTAVDLIKRKWKREYWRYKDSLEIYPFLKSENLI